MASLISIIIPTFNRGHLIEETLDSILAQTYTNWECIVVDDGSKDNTEKIVKKYTKQDKRFQYHKRPENRPKGANSCRNHGFELSTGEYINWFDSDDLMLPEFLQSKIDVLQEFNCDFVISKTQNFDKQEDKDLVFDLKLNESGITAEDFITQKIAWCTLDFMCTRQSVNGIKFNESLKSGQEYNFFAKYLFNTEKGIPIGQVLAKRRLHNTSIQQLQKLDDKVYRQNKYDVYFKTYQEIKDFGNSTSLNYLLNLSMSKAFEKAKHKEQIPFFRKLMLAVVTHKGATDTFRFLCSLCLGYGFKKGYRLMNLARGKK